MTRSNSRRMQAIVKRREKGVRAGIEMLHAAYIKHSNIDPVKASLMVKPDEATGAIRYWFEHYEPTINDQSAHPHVKYLVAVSQQLAEAHKTGQLTQITELLQELTTFIDTYYSLDGDAHVATRVDDENVPGAVASKP